MSKMFFGGMPTAVELRQLKEAFGEPTPGTEIAHEDVESVIGVDRNKSRYRTITHAWRRSLEREHNLHVACIRGVGFRSLTDEERIAEGIGGVQSGARKIMRAGRQTARVATSDPILRTKQDHVHRMAVAIANEVNTGMQQIEPPKPAVQRPRVLLPIKASGGRE